MDVCRMSYFHRLGEILDLLFHFFSDSPLPFLYNAYNIVFLSATKIRKVKVLYDDNNAQF